MIMALFTGCGSNKNAKTKDNGSYFKEVKKMQEIRTGTGEVELSFDVSADSIKKDKTIPAKFKKDGKIQGKLKVETTTESTSKLAAKISLQYLTDTALAVITKIELEINRKVFLPSERGRFISEFDTSAILRTDKSAQAAFWKDLATVGAATPNEVRRENNMPRIENGDKAFVQVNVQTLDNAVKEKVDEPQNNPDLSDKNLVS